MVNATVNNIPDQDDNNPVDIRAQHDPLNKRFTTLTLSKSDITDVDLFNTLKASNAPMILFDWIINWVQRHDPVITQNGTHQLMKREIFLQDLNKNCMQNRILMEPTVSKILLIF